MQSVIVLNHKSDFRRRSALSALKINDHRLRNQWLIVLNIESADRHRKSEEPFRTNTSCVRTNDAKMSEPFLIIVMANNRGRRFECIRGILRLDLETVKMGRVCRLPQNTRHREAADSCPPSEICFPTNDCKERLNLLTNNGSATNIARFAPYSGGEFLRVSVLRGES